MALLEGILGKKLGMYQIFDPEGNVIPVTAVQAGPCTVVKKKTIESDKYNAVQLGFEPIREKLVTKPVMGVYNKRGVDPCRYLKEFRLSAELLNKYDENTPVTVEMFNPGDMIDVTGTSKGKGFQGVMKRHGFGGSKGSHGVHEYFRHGGSIGSSAYPSHVFKGVRMSGHMGAERVTVQNLQIIHVLADKNIVLIKGAVPGPNNGILEIRRAAKHH